MNRHLQRGLLLFQQSRLELAEESLRRAVASDPQDSQAHATLGLCLATREKYEEATRSVEEAIRLAPDDWFAHHALACVMRERNRLREALRAAQEAIRVNPYSATAWSTLALVELDGKRWSRALAAAGRGLQIDPQDNLCVNVRAAALVKLGRSAEAGVTMQTALADEPEDALTHANQGWVMLERGRHQEAKEHFREALRLDPNLEYAQAGMVTALKARNFLYRVLLNYFLWMAKLSSGVQWALIVGLYVVLRIVQGIAREKPELAPYLTPVMILYGIFVLLTWTADPIFNLLLRLDRFGRYVLSRDEARAADFAGLCLLVAVTALGIAVGTGNGTFLLAAASAGVLIIPVSAVYQCDEGWPRQIMAALAIVLTILVLAGLATAMAGFEAAPVLLGLALVGSMLSTWAANVLIPSTVKR